MGNNTSLAKNSFYSLLNRGFNVLYPLIISAYLSRIFNADGVGRIMFAINIVTYFTLAASLGIPNYAIRVIANKRNSRIATSNSFTEIATIIFISSTIATFSYYIFSYIIYRNDIESLKIAMALGLMVLTNVTNYDWLFEAEEDFRYLAFRSIIVKSIIIITIFLVVRTKEDIVIYSLLYSGITVLNNICNAIYFKKYVSYNFKRMDMRPHMKPIIVLFSAAVATDVYILLDSTMLGAMAPPEYLGYYSNSSRLIRATFGMLASATAAFTPRLNYLYHNNKDGSYEKLLLKYYDVTMFISIPATIGVFALAPQIIIVLFGNNFIPSIVTLRILTVLILCFSIATVFGHVCLIIYRKEKLLLVATIVGAVSNFGLNMKLIPFFFHNGVAISSVISEIIVTFLMAYSSIRVVKIPLLNKNLLKVLFASIFMLFVIYILIQLSTNPYICLICGIILGTLVYFLCSCFMEHEIALVLKSRGINVIKSVIKIRI